jgi:Zn-dependent oligopeptidase
MEPKEFKDLLEEIYSTTNANGELSKLLTRIYDAFDEKHVDKLKHEKDYQEIATTNSQLEEMNEKLRGVNMDLFLKVGAVKKEKETTQQEEENIPDLTEVYE